MQREWAICKLAHFYLCCCLQQGEQDRKERHGQGFKGGNISLSCACLLFVVVCRKTSRTKRSDRKRRRGGKAVVMMGALRREETREEKRTWT
jgi:hypothetical protein